MICSKRSNRTRSSRVGLGWVNGRYFLFHVGMGFDAAVVAQVERRAGLKRYAGHPLFVYAAVATWFRHFDRSARHGSRSTSATDTIDDGLFRAVPQHEPLHVPRQPTARHRP